MILSIDPGINNCGLAVVKVHNEKAMVLEHINVKNAGRLSDAEKMMEAAYGPRVVKISRINAQVQRLLSAHPEISACAIEAPFYSALTPLAYGSLLEVISAIKYQVIVPTGLPVKMIEPLTVKKMFLRSKLIKGMTAKQVMRDFLVGKVTCGEIVLPEGTVGEDLTEHEIDAIAVGYVYHYQQAQQALENAK